MFPNRCYEMKISKKMLTTIKNNLYNQMTTLANYLLDKGLISDNEYVDICNNLSKILENVLKY